jgi:hypothetical protein
MRVLSVTVMVAVPAALVPHALEAVTNNVSGLVLPAVYVIYHQEC